MNTVNLVGNLARDVEVRQLSGDNVIGKTLLAISRYGKREGTDYIRIVLWGKHAINAGRYLRKGSRVGIVGRLSSEFYERKSGAGTGLDTEVVVDQIEYLSPPPKSSEPAAENKGGKR
jgi:single-strand DNA-binding protein